MANDIIFQKVVDVKSAGGNLKRQYSLLVTPWSFEADAEKNTPAVSGHTCKISVMKLGLKPSNSFINIDPADKNLRDALAEMYKEYDKAIGK